MVSHISATNFFLMDAPLAPALPPFGAGRMRFICITGIPDPWLYNAIETGAPQWHEKPLERQRFWSLNQEHFVDLNF
jgi:hypothetical protein